MIDYLEQLFDRVPPLVTYLILGVSSFLENVIPPVPGDTVVVLGAYLVSIDKLDFWGVYISTTIGSLIGFMTMYLIGRYLGRPFIYRKRARAKVFKESRIEKAEFWFQRWGLWVIFANRFLSGTRSVISLAAGLFHLNFLWVMVLALLSAAIWHGILITAGILVGNNWQVISTVIMRYNQLFLILLAVAVIVFVYRRRTKRTSSTGSHSD